MSLTLAIDMGHTLSGADYGAVGILRETDVTRAIGAKLIEKLIARGNKVINITDDYSTSVNQSLEERVAKANAQYVDLVICIHGNANDNEQANGTETFIDGTGGRAEDYAYKIQSQITKLGYTNRGVKVDDVALGYNLYMLHYTDAPAVLIETFFVTSPSDCNKYNPDAIAEAIAYAVTGITAPTSGSVYNGVVSNVTNYLNVRNAPSGTIIGRVFPNEKVRINSEKNGWYNITYDTSLGKLTKSGYASKSYITRL